MKKRKYEIECTCTLTDEELKHFKEGWGDTTPCMEWGCEECPYIEYAESEGQNERGYETATDHNKSV